VRPERIQTCSSESHYILADLEVYDYLGFLSAEHRPSLQRKAPRGVAHTQNTRPDGIQTHLDHPKTNPHAWVFWFSTLNQHVYYESHLEKRTLLILDFHGKVQAILDQPFAIHFDGKAHVPDYLVQYANGQTSILDVKMKSRQSNEKVVQAFDATRKAAEELGWWYEIHCEQDAQYEINLDWLSGFRRPSAKVAQYRPSILQALMPDPLEFSELVRVVGDPLFSKPVIFNMLWRKELAMDMNVGITERSLIRMTSQALTS
jgi:hypothetical protein